MAKGGRTRGRTCQLIQFLSDVGRSEGLLLGASTGCEPEFLGIPAFKAILFRTVPGDVPRVKTCRQTFSPPEVAGIQEDASPRPHVIQELCRVRMSSGSASQGFRIVLIVFGLPYVLTQTRGFLLDFGLAYHRGE